MNNLKKEEVIEFFGNGARTSEALHISPSAVSMWDDTLGAEITLKALGATLLHLFGINEVPSLNKHEVIEFFGNGTRVSEAIGISPSAVYMWSDLLGQEITLKVFGAAVLSFLKDILKHEITLKAVADALLHHNRLKKVVPANWLEMTE